MKRTLNQLVQPKFVELMRSFIVRWNTELQQNKLTFSDLGFFWSVFKPNAQRFWDTHTKPSASIHRDVISQSLASTMIPSSSGASFQFHSPSKVSTFLSNSPSESPCRELDCGVEIETFSSSNLVPMTACLDAYG